MTTHLKSGESQRRLQLIREYVELQEALVVQAVSQLHPSATEYDFKESLPKSVTVNQVEWSTQAHGVGVMFTNTLTNIVIDAHVGFLDAPSAFDAWRLVQFEESQLRMRIKFDDWQSILTTFADQGVIERHKGHQDLYLLKELQ